MANASESLAAIEAQCDKNFRHLHQNGIDPDLFDDFENFLRDPATLNRESLILRCIFSNGAIETRVILERARSQRRKETNFDPFLQRIASRIEGDFEVFILLSDTIYVADAKREQFVSFLMKIPFLRCDWLEGDAISEHAIIIPDFRLLAGAYAKDLAAVSRAAVEIPYEKRSEKIGWRGRLSGPDYPDINNCERFPRYHLFREAARHPDIADVRVSNFTNFGDSDAAQTLRREIEAMVGPPAPELRPEEFARYKYLLAVDGVTAPWKTVPMRLATGSVLLMQHRWQQYFSVALEAWRHYLPLRSDFADLAERHMWLCQNPEEARMIGQSGQSLVNEILTPAAIDDFFIGVLDRCRTLIRR